MRLLNTFENKLLNAQKKSVKQEGVCDEHEWNWNGVRKELFEWESFEKWLTINIENDDDNNSTTKQQQLPMMLAPSTV